MVERLDRLRHHAVVGGDDQDRDVSHLRTASPHCGERLVPRGVDEGDCPVFPFVVDVHLVGPDVLGDATGLGFDNVGVADSVEQLGLAVVDVAHNGHDRRASDQAFLVFLGLEVDGKGLEQLAVLVLGRDHLEVVAQFLTEQLEGVLVDGLGGRDHLAEVEQHLDQRTGLGVDPLGEIGERRSARQPDGLSVSAWDPHSADRGCLHVVVFLALLPLALAAPSRLSAWPAEGASRAAAAPAAGARASSEPTAGTWPAGEPAAGPGATGTTGTATALTGSGTAGPAGPVPLARSTRAGGAWAGRHHSWRRTRTARSTTAGRAGRDTAGRGARSSCTGRGVGARLRPLHACRPTRGERVVAGPGTGRATAHSGAFGPVWVVARTGAAGPRHRWPWGGRSRLRAYRRRGSGR